MDIGDLLPSLERLYLERRAMQAILEEGDRHWRRDVLRYCRQPKPNAEVEATFRALRDSLQSGEAVEIVIPKVLEVLNKMTL
jgi:hypothetical protein